MGIAKERTETGWLVRVAGELGALEAGGLKEALLEVLGDPEPGPVVLDLAEVEHVDICCLQVVLAAWRSAQKAGRELTLGAMSAACREAVGLAGLEAAQLPPCLERGSPPSGAPV